MWSFEKAVVAQELNATCAALGKDNVHYIHILSGNCKDEARVPTASHGVVEGGAQPQ